MEEQGMGRRKRSLRLGLLTDAFSKKISRLTLLFALLFCAGFLFSQADGGENKREIENEEVPVPLEMRIETSSAAPFINNPWSVYILINHPNPREVNVSPPRFPLHLVLERVRTEARFVSQGERWTRVEFLFTPQRGGALTIGPFEVTVPGRRALTETITVRFREPAVRRYEPRFRWEAAAVSFTGGEKGELLLELTNWDPAKKAPQGIFQGRAPRNAILEESLPAELREGVYRYTVSIIPLEGNSVVLGAHSFQAEGFSLNIPETTIQILPARRPQKPEPAAGAVGLANDSSRGSPLLTQPDLSFPAKRENVFPFFRPQYNQIIARAGALWEEGRRAEALAEIRRNERDSLPGPSLVPLRREMEQALNLGYTSDEKWRPLGIPLLFWIILGFFLLFAGVILLFFRPRPVIRRKDVTSRGGGGFKIVIAAVLLSALVLIFLVEGLGDFPAGRLSSALNAAVLKESTAYRVPDLKGAVNARFGEGQPVIVDDDKGEWCYAESPDGRSGWVLRAQVITY